MSNLCCIAYYLGQFHPTEENDHFWGEGFTEWHNVAKARPLYPGHKQPKLPGKLGFYDLRYSGTLSAQIEYAQEIGITAFCFWHYWFAGRRVLHVPLDNMLKLRPSRFRFVLGWANESWSGIWHGAPRRILLEQSYHPGEREAHAELIASYIDSGCYLEIDGRFPMVIYRPRQVPNAADYLTLLRDRVERLTGAKLYLVGNWSPGRSLEFKSPHELGLDAAVITPVAAYYRNPAIQFLYKALWMGFRRVGAGPEIRNYASVIRTTEVARSIIRGTAHSTVVTGWDNTPRSGRRGLVLYGYNEESFEDAVRHAIASEAMNSTPILFVKSWNEWAEGNTVEPLFHERWSAGSILQKALRLR